MSAARPLAFAAAAVALAGAVSAAVAGGTRDLADGWVVPPAAFLAPAGPDAGLAAEERGIWAASGLARLHGLPELPLLALATGFRAARWEVAVSWQRLGGDLLREERLRCRFVAGGGVRLGLAVGWDTLALSGGAAPPGAAALSCEIEAACARGTRLTASLPLLACPAWYGRGGARRWMRFAGGGDEGAWAVALDRDADGVPLVEAEAALRLGARGACGLRWEPATGTAGPTWAWRVAGLLVRSSHLAHPILGVTHRWALQYGAPGEMP